MADRLRITLEDGKYTVIQPENGGAYALRHGLPWRECVGDNLVLCLAQEVAELREKLGVQLPGDHG